MSASVDLAQLAAGVRPAIRTEMSFSESYETVARWARRHGWNIDIDIDNFIAISPSFNLCRRIIRIDRYQHDHTYQLGRELGYPKCCCRAAERVGESNLDTWEFALAERPFLAPFDAIDPSLYRYGRSLISHIPCSTNCVPSLNMAIDLLRAERECKSASYPLGVPSSAMASGR